MGAVPLYPFIPHLTKSTEWKQQPMVSRRFGETAFRLQDPQRTALHGVLQVAVGLHHLLNSNHRGCMIEFGEGIRKLDRLGRDTDMLLAFAEDARTLLDFMHNTQVRALPPLVSDLRVCDTWRANASCASQRRFDFCEFDSATGKRRRVLGAQRTGRASCGWSGLAQASAGLTGPQRGVL